MLMGGAGAAEANMASMKAALALDRDHARAKRLVQVKFVALPLEVQVRTEELHQPSVPALAWPARIAASLRDSIIRVIGCLEAARP